MNTIPLISNPIAELTSRRDSIVQTIAKLAELSQKVTYQSIERVNSVALFNIKAKHPQEVTVEIGGVYFAKMTANQAIGLYQRRLKNIEAEIAHRSKDGKQRSEQKESERPVGMAKTIKLDEGGKQGYMEVIGEENGEEIFNIVEIQGEEDEEQNAQTKQAEKVTVAPPVTTQTAPTQGFEKAEGRQEVEGNMKAGFDSEASFDPSDEEEEEQGEKSQKSQKSAKSNESDSEPQDLIQYHRKQIIGIKPRSSLPQNLNSSTIINPASKSEGILPAGDTASPVQAEKKKKRVSFADQRDGGKLQQMLREEETRKEKKAKKEQSTKTKQASGQVKEVKLEKGAKIIPDQPVASKVSKFKLQRMKQRMQREGK